MKLRVAGLGLLALGLLLSFKWVAGQCKDSLPERVLIFTCQKAGGSLLADVIAQHPNAVGPINLYPGKEAPDANLLPRLGVSAFQLFARSEMKKWELQYPEKTKPELFKLMGDKFFGMPEREQQPWKDKEQQAALPQNQPVVIVKALTNPWVLGWQYIASFRPTVKVLMVRHPAHLVASMKITAENERSGGKKLRQLDHAFNARDRLFNVTVLYEHLMMDQTAVAQALQDIGFCPETITALLALKRSTKEMLDATLKECDWCERHKWKEWDAKTSSSRIHLDSSLLDKRPTAEHRTLAQKYCPALTAHYAEHFPKL